MCGVWVRECLDEEITFSFGLIQQEMLWRTRGKDLWYLKLMLSKSIWPLEGQPSGGLVSVSLGASDSRLQYSKMRSTDVIWQDKAITTDQSAKYTFTITCLELWFAQCLAWYPAVVRFSRWPFDHWPFACRRNVSCWIVVTWLQPEIFASY